MLGAAPVDQSPQERSKRPSTDSSSTLPYSYNVSNPSSPSSSPVVSTLNSPSGVSPITIPPDIPIKVEYHPDPIPVPSLFHFPGYSTSTSTPSFFSISTLYTPHVTDNPALANPSGQEVSHSIPPFQPTLIIGSLSIPPQSLFSPYSSSSFSFDMPPPLSSSVTHDQNLPSCFFVTPKVIPPFTSTSPVSSSILSTRKPRGRQPVRGKSSRGHSSREKPPRGQGRGCTTPSGHSSYSSFGSHNFRFSHSSPMSSQGYLSRDGALDLSTRPMVCCYFPQNPQLIPSLPTTPFPPKSFLP